MSSTNFSQPAPFAVAAALLAWAAAGQLRDLPWRREPRDPYEVWISEVMLQQTQVDTVVPYWERWLVRFPTIQDLASASLGDVLKAWEGLGYYGRARNLHRSACIIEQEHGGRLPADRQALLALPGIGRYTAGAILSLAFGQRAAVVDGNVRRVLARVYDVTGEVDRSATQTELWRLAEALVKVVPAAQVGRLNEALMDLGATRCGPQAPRCKLCPLQELCLAQRRGSQLARPVRSTGPPIPHVDVTAAVLDRPGHPGQFLIAQRPPNGMLGGLWEFPGGNRHEGESLSQCLRRELQEELGIDVAVGQLITTINHAYTHFKITLSAFSCKLLDGTPRAIGVADWRWVTLDDLDAYPFPVTDQKIIAALQGLSSS